MARIGSNNKSNIKVVSEFPHNVIVIYNASLRSRRTHQRQLALKVESKSASSRVVEVLTGIFHFNQNLCYPFQKYKPSLDGCSTVVQ